MADRKTIRSRATAYPPFAQPDLNRRMIAVPQGAADPPAEDELPPIEQFIDDLPSIDDYLSQEDDEGWAVAEWQSYDWSMLSELGHLTSRDSEADASWSSSEWSQGDSNPVGSPGGPSADEVAAALDGIAHRIRSGELSIDQFHGTPPEAAMAAALAALLRLRG
jgi:hypothetical protein